jgi:hypothetical protein
MGFPHFERPRTSGSFFVAAAGMLAKPRGQGKRGNILLAMPQARFSMARISNCKSGIAPGGMPDKS